MIAGDVCIMSEGRMQVRPQGCDSLEGTRLCRCLGRDCHTNQFLALRKFDHTVSKFAMVHISNTDRSMFHLMIIALTDRQARAEKHGSHRGSTIGDSQYDHSAAP